MRNLLFTYLAALTSLTLHGQVQETWSSFWNKDTTLMGFKDKKGKVKIQPKFTGFTSANKFDKIIAVTEEKNETWDSYYLTKSGRIVGKDSLYIFDNTFDCESEGLIRFRDKKSHKVGMFDKDGNIAIPAEYNNLAPVRNGLIIAMRNAFWDEKKRSEFFPYPWIAGKISLIDIHNSIVIDSFSLNDDINFFSLLISKNPSRDTIRQNFKAVNGQYYSFINFDKEFNAWLKLSLLNDCTKSQLLKASYDQLTFWKEPIGWTRQSKISFINRNFELLQAKLLQLKSTDSHHGIIVDGLNPLMYPTEEFQIYFNNCGEPKEWIYPLIDLIISYNENKKLLQDHFEFLRTDKGYKLISITIRKGKVK